MKELRFRAEHLVCGCVCVYVLQDLCRAPGILIVSAVRRLRVCMQGLWNGVVTCLNNLNPAADFLNVEPRKPGLWLARNEGVDPYSSLYDRVHYRFSIPASPANQGPGNLKP